MMLGLEKRTWAASFAVLAVLLFALTRSVRADQVFAIHATLQNAAVATGNGTALDVGGLSAVGVQVQGITTATITWEVSVDGANWKGVIATDTRTQAQGTTATADDIYSVNTAGFQWLRARISAYTAGTITATALGATNGVAAGAAAGGGGGGAVTIASGGVASGAYSAGSIAAGAFVSGSVLSGAFSGGAIVDRGTIADAATSGTGTLNAHARQTALNTANIPAPGQAVMAASTPVAIASNQSALTVNNATAANLNATVVGSGNFTVVGTAAHGASVSGNPLLTGAEAVNTQRAVVTNGQVSRLTTDLAGRLITIPYAGTEDSLQGYATATGTANTQLIATQAAGVRIYVTSVIVDNNSATNSEVDIKDGTTIIATLPAPATSGAAHPFPVPLKGTAATALNFASVTAVTTMKVTVVGFKGY